MMRLMLFVSVYHIKGNEMIKQEILRSTAVVIKRRKYVEEKAVNNRAVCQKL